MVEYTLYRLRKGQLTGGGPRKKSKPSIFIAFSFASEISRSFRKKIEQVIKRTPSLRGIDIKDGRVPVGTYWPKEIRNRLSKARIVIAEFSRLSPEVLFETGFAYGLNKAILPVTKSSEDLKLLPRFLTEIQFGVHSSEDCIVEVIKGISECVSKQKRNVNDNSIVTRSSPNNVVLICSNDKYSIIDKVKNFCMQNEMKYDHVSVEGDFDYNEYIDSKVFDASLLIGYVDGREQDNIISFSAGIVCAHPSAGIGKHKLTKKVIFVMPDNGDVESLVPDSARRVTKTVKVVKESGFNEALSSFAQLRRKWQLNQELENVN